MMKMITCRQIILQLCLVTIMVAPLKASDDRELWLDGIFKFPRSKCIEPEISTSFRYDNDFTRLYTYFLQASLKIHLSNHWVLMPSFREANGKLTRSDGTQYWQQDHQVLVDLTYKKRFKSFKIEDRNRYQYREFFNTWFYRNRLRIFYHGLEDLIGQVYPFVFGEIYFLELERHTQTRLGAGVRAKVNDRFTGSVAYMYRDRIRSFGWFQTDVMILEGRFSF